MSRRPVVGNPVRRRNDVRRRMWSESPIPRVATRRVRFTGSPPLLCADPDWVITSQGDTYAVFEGSYNWGVSLGIGVGWTSVSAVDFWIADVTVSGTATKDVPSETVSITGAETDNCTFYYDPPGVVGGYGTITMIRIEWDTPGAFTALCVSTADYT